MAANEVRKYPFDYDCPSYDAVYAEMPELADELMEGFQTLLERKFNQWRTDTHLFGDNRIREVEETLAKDREK